MNQIIESDESSSTSIIARQINDANDTDEDAYEQYKTYENLQECLKDIKEGLVENTTWGAKEIKKTESGEKRFYKCSRCKKRLYILIHRTSLKKKVFDLYFEQKMKTKDIGRWLRNNLNDGNVELKDSVINNLISRKKRNRTNDDDPGKSIDALINLARSRSEFPEDDHTMFVV
ncbi:unnamed protein product [Brachionus calyciflorus]|uniref:Uncharacterized protein n=1 Tax=Brachionus calyciflorus TaxID=104777 RepID=A0A814NHQ7_9BILA|nr:unnamed protein product [Brachionus calyciflorus]